MAEYLLKERWRRAGRYTDETASAGTHAVEGWGATQETLEVLAEEGIDASHHRARRLTAEMVEEADRIFVMTEAHRQWVVNQLKAPEAKVQLLRPDEVPDPIGHSLEVYRRCRDAIKEGVEGVMKEWGQAAPQNPQPRQPNETGGRSEPEIS